LVRKEFDGRSSKNMTERTNLLVKEAAILKYIAEEFMIPVSTLSISFCSTLSFLETFFFLFLIFL
jgi:hypothetical protein